jgi:hypothetical protein
MATATIPAVLRVMEDWPGNPGWWRYGQPRVVRATQADLDRWSCSSSYAFYTCSTMSQARRWCGQDRADWRRAHG